MCVRAWGPQIPAAFSITSKSRVGDEALRGREREREGTPFCLCTEEHIRLSFLLRVYIKEQKHMGDIGCCERDLSLFLLLNDAYWLIVVVVVVILII